MFNNGLFLFTGGGGTPLVNDKSLNFDGVDEYVTYGNNYGFETDTPFSVSIWAKPTNTSAQRAMFAKNSVDANVFGYMLYHNSSGQLFLQARAPSQLRLKTWTDLTMTAGVWQHVVLTYDGSQNINGFRAYLDGTVGATPSSGSLTNSWVHTDAFTVGRRSNAFYWLGSLDELGIWDKALDSSEVSDLYNGGTPVDLTTHSAAANLVHWSRMGDGDTFPTITDNSSSGNDGTMTNMESGDIQSDTP